MSELVPPGAGREQLFREELSLQAQREWELIPVGEQEALLAAAESAVELAAAGRPERGRDVLVAALRRAEDGWRGNPWGQELVRCHQEMVERFDRWLAGPVTPAT